MAQRSACGARGGETRPAAQRWPEAETAFRTDLVAQPGSGWALRGLRASLLAQGKTEAANKAGAELSKTWASADAALLNPSPQ